MGSASRLCLADDVVVLVIDQDKNSFIVAVGRSDGKVRWQKPRPEALSGASTPVVVKRSTGPSLILAPASFRMDVYSARDGEAVWWVLGLPSEMKSAACRRRGPGVYQRVQYSGERPWQAGGAPHLAGTARAG